MEFVLVIVIFVATLYATRFADPAIARRLVPVVVVAFLGRLIVHVAVIRSQLIAYGGDQNHYESLALKIASVWRTDGFQFVTGDHFAELNSVAVPCNLFALFVYAADGPAPLACTAAIAFVAVALCLVVYRFARLIGASEDASFRLFVLTLFGPSFFLHTSDMFKDGINALLVVVSLYLAVSTAKRFSPLKLVLIAPCLWLLWHVRPYMVFMTAIPIGLGVVGLRRALSAQGALILAISLIAGLVYIESGTADQAMAQAEEQFDRATDTTVRDANAMGGSGVTFDDGGKAWGALGPKLAYTVLSPFPWMAGSVTLQLGKIETLLWYYLIWEAIRGARWLWGRERETLFLLALFIIPATLAYATTMANVGLILRQRMPIVIVTSLLSAIAWTHAPQKRTASAPVLPRRQQVE